MVDELFNLDDLLNYDKYQETIPQYSFKESLADVAPSSVITSNTVPSLSQSVGVAREPYTAPPSSRTNEILKSFSGLLSENNNALPLDTSNQQLAEIAATSLAPALIGLIMKGKQGAGIGAAIGGQAGAALAQRQRAEAIKQAELTNVNQREQRQILNNLLSNATAEERIAAQERIAEANRAAAEGRLDKQLQGMDERLSKRSDLSRELEENKQTREEDKRKYEATVAGYKFPIDPETGKEQIPNKNAAKSQQELASTMGAIRGGAQLAYDVVTDPKTSTSEKKTALEGLLLQMRKEGFGNSGASFTGSERAALTALLPSNFTLTDTTSVGEIFGAIQKNIDGFTPPKAFALLENILNAQERGVSEGNGYIVPERKPLFQAPSIQQQSSPLKFNMERALQYKQQYQQGVRK